MARWTSRYEFPAKLSSGLSMSVKIRDDIWTISARLNAKSSQMIVFKTETREYNVIDCPLPESYRHYVGNCFSHNDQIYTWSGYAPFREEMVLHRLDPDTLRSEYIMKSDNRYYSCVIVDNIMYALYQGNSKNIYLDIINLDRKKVISSKLMEEFKECVCLRLTSYKRRLCLVRYSHDENSRSVSIFEDGVFMVIHDDHCEVNTISNRCEFAGFSSVICKHSTCEHQVISLESFNYLKNKWEQVVKVDKCWVHSQACDFFEIHGTIYTVLINRNCLKEIRLLEITPKLSTICLLNAVDYCMIHGGIEECGNLISDLLRDEWNGILDLRVTEQNKIRRQFEVAVREEFENMRKDRLINDVEQFILISSFNGR